MGVLWLEQHLYHGMNQQIYVQEQDEVMTRSLVFYRYSQWWKVCDLLV